MRGHATEFWIEDVTGACGWCCHTCGIDIRTRNMADAEAAIDAHESAPDPAPAGVSAAPTSRDSHVEDSAGATKREGTHEI